MRADAERLARVFAEVVSTTVGARSRLETRPLTADDFLVASTLQISWIALQAPGRRFDRHLRSTAQVEAASRAEMLRDKLDLVEGRDSAAAGRASIPKTTTMLETGHTRCQPPLPAKIGHLVIGKALRAILHPG